MLHPADPAPVPAEAIKAQVMAGRDDPQSRPWQLTNKVSRQAAES